MACSLQCILGVVTMTLFISFVMPAPSQEPAVSKLNDLESISPLSFKPLGTVDGKTFLAETTQMSWARALAHCATYGYQLASIENDEQLKFLSEALNSNGQRMKWFWTSGQVSRLISMFRWVGAPAPIAPDAFKDPDFAFMEGPSHYCLSVLATNASHANIRGTLCSRTNLFPLCQQ